MAGAFDSGNGAFGLSPYQQGMGGGAIGGLLGGLFGDSGAPYDKAMEQYKQWNQKGENAQNPFYNAGVQGMGNYQDWLQGMKDPAQFMNNLQGQYKASPYSQYLQGQSMRAGQNAASASGLMGSTPLAEQMQQNASNIASGDMNNWLQNVLGINTQYGQGQQNMTQMGQNSANALTNMYSQMGQNMGQAAYGKEAGKQQDLANMLGGGASLAMMFL